MLSSCRRCLPAIRGNSYRLSNDPCLLSLYNNIDLYDLNNLTFVCVCHNRIHKATFLPAKQQVLSNKSLHKYEEFQSATIMRSKKIVAYADIIRIYEHKTADCAYVSALSAVAKSAWTVWCRICKIFIVYCISCQDRAPPTDYFVRRPNSGPHV